MGLTSTIAEMAGHAFKETGAVEISRVEIGVHRLPAAFAGLRVVQISEVHHSSFLSAERIREIVVEVNALGGDVVVLTGDYVSYSPYYIAGAAEALGGLEAPLGVYAVLGNHDFWNNANEMAAALEREGIVVLRNANTRLEVRGETIVMAGIDDLSVGAADLGRALCGADARSVRLLLSHNPGIIRRAALEAADLVLAGHTHAGQVHVPLIGAPSVYGYPKQLVSGLTRVGATQIYVNRGLGTVIVPVRVGSLPEVTVFTLVEEAALEREAS